VSAKLYNVAVVGATGAVGEEMIKILAQRNFPINEIKLLASSRSAGINIDFMGEQCVVEELTTDSFSGVDIALFSAGAIRSREFARVAVDAGAVVVDNSSAFRNDPEVPLIVPEVNGHSVGRHNGIIANPNCATIQMVLVLKPLHDIARVKRVVVSTYQSVSGAGKQAINELSEQTRQVFSMQDINPVKFPYQIAFNCIPHIDVFDDTGYTNEELKMVNETKKIMEDYSIELTATTVRVPIFYCHCESVNLEFEKPLSADQAKTILSSSQGIEVVDNTEHFKYPMAIDAAGKDLVYVGRIRDDNTVENGLNLWVVADNIRKGAALNAVQIAEKLTEE
jgi:aspartate-semialdehyde dehydrogenase|tara:strand:- start:173674 stop:174684 length:1011 start_codon:yes stop_codon:yes gene_type:complete